MRALLGYPLVVVLTFIGSQIGAAMDWGSWTTFFASFALVMPAIMWAVSGDLSGDRKDRRPPHLG